MIAAGIVGATGYFGLELVRLLLQHDQVELRRVCSRTYAGQRLDEVFPHLRQVTDLQLEAFEPAFCKDLDVLFLCTPHGVAARLVPEILDYDCVAIDVSADFRLKDPEVYRKWYKSEPAPNALLAEAVYGLPELYGEAVKQARVIGNPGCYPTSILLGLAPLVKSGLVDLEHIVVDSKSGVSGAGRTKLELPYHFPEADENLAPYAVQGHRHSAEINQVLSELAQSQVQLAFTPHLVPMVRGILSSIYLFAKAPVEAAQVQALYEEFYARAPFVRVLPQGKLPGTKYTCGTNFCDVAVNCITYTARPMVIVHSALDNLVKGAAGQAVQNMNLRFGLPETAGLQHVGLYP